MGVIRAPDPDVVLNPDELSSAVDAALMRARADITPDTATAWQHAHIPDLTGLSEAQPVPTLALLDRSIVASPDASMADVGVGSMPVNADTGRFQKVDFSPEQPAFAEGSKDAADEPIAAPKPAVRAAAKPQQPDRNTRIRNIAKWLARYYRADPEAVANYVRYAHEAGARHGLDPMLIIAVMSIESSLNPRARSHKDARGLMQVLVKAHPEKFERFGGVDKAFNPRVSVEVGATILKGMIERTGSVEKALKHYVGAANLSSDRGYGAKVIRQRDRIWAASLGRTVPQKPPLQAAIERANQAQQAMAAQVSVVASSGQ